MDYKPNSNRFREQQKNEVAEKKVEKVVSGKVKTKKKSEAKKLADVFLAEDVDSVKTYIWSDVLVPSIKKAISDVVKSSIDMLLYGGSNPNKNGGAASRVSYRSYYDSNNSSRPVGMNRQTYDCEDVILDDRGEAEEVLERMDELIAAYGMVSVADFYDLVGVTRNYTDNKYGWDDIHTAKVVRVSGGGYMIKLPRVKPL